MYSSTGQIRYREGLWVTAYIDQELADYYLSLIPKYYRVKKPRWEAHVTVVRPEDEPKNVRENWGKHNNEIVEFIYDPTLQEERGIWWFNLWCKIMEQIRLELDLSIKSRITRPPWPGYNKCFHCTVGTIF